MTLCIVCSVSTSLARTYTTWLTGRGPQKPFTLKATINYPEETLMYPLLGVTNNLIIYLPVRRLEKCMFLVSLSTCTFVKKSMSFICMELRFRCTIGNVTCRYTRIVFNVVTLCLHYVPVHVVGSLKMPYGHPNFRVQGRSRFHHSCFDSLSRFKHLEVRHFIPLILCKQLKHVYYN